MPFTFECPYCGDQFSDRDDLDDLRAEQSCPGCQTEFDPDELDELLPDADEFDPEGESADFDSDDEEELDGPDDDDDIYDGDDEVDDEDIEESEEQQ